MKTLALALLATASLHAADPIDTFIEEQRPSLIQLYEHLHAHPELSFHEEKTSARMTQEIRAAGFEVTEKVGGWGVVAVLKNGPGRTVLVRTDLDGLPVREIGSVPYVSKTITKDDAGNDVSVMHACGHDGHTAMLLGAAKYLAETRNFAGSVALIFQPAEEGGGGGNIMVQEGMMDRFGIAKVFGMHNMPGLPVGQFAIRPGPIMAATAEFTITIRGKGGHAAMPHRSIDPIVVASQLVGAFQTIVSRTTDPIESLVVTVTKFHAGDAYNIIPEQAEIAGTVRTLKKEVAALARERIHAICAGIGAAFGATIAVDYDANYPVTFNHADETVVAAQIAADVAGEARVNRAMPPVMGGEDFSYMLEARPGAFIFMGNGDTAGLHHPAYDFNDEALPHGMSYWIRLAETTLAA